MGTIGNVAIIGAGLVGSGWTVVFARSGATVRVFDSDAAIRASVLDRIRASLEDMQAIGLVDQIDAIMARVSVCDSLAEAVAEADYVQELVLEVREVKSSASLEIDCAMRPDAVVGSSSSGIPGSAFTGDCANRSRFLIAHPVNPPHLVPVVELVQAPWTDPAIVPWLRTEMERIGQVVVVVNWEIEGFILNRLQGALLNEAWALFDGGYASAADIDATVAHGLGLRWSFMGPFETIDLNAPGGVADYARRLRAALSFDSAGPHPAAALVGRTDSPGDKRAAGGAAGRQLAERRAWRDSRLMKLIAHKRAR